MVFDATEIAKEGFALPERLNSALPVVAAGRVHPDRGSLWPAMLPLVLLAMTQR